MNAPASSPAHLPAYGPLIEHFLIDRGLVFLNHGSFGATPRGVLDAQQRLRVRVEADPVAWFGRDLEPQMDAARAQVAAFIDAPEDQIVPVVNATHAVSTIVASLGLRAGDELLTTTHEYNACNNALRQAEARWGAKVVAVPFPWPLRRTAEVTAALVAGVTPRTRLVLVSYITSASGIALPAAEMTRSLLTRAAEVGNTQLAVLIDGAHAPGYLDLSVRELAAAGASYFTGNLHKWACGPKGSAVLWVKPDLHDRTPPLVVSHGFNAGRTDRPRFRMMHDYVGSTDYTPWLCAPAAIAQVGAMAGSWVRVRARCGEMIDGALGVLKDRLGELGEGVGEIACPRRAVGQMAAVVLPNRASPAPFDPASPFDPLYHALYNRWKIQVPVYGILRPDGTRGRVVRISAALYNAPEQYEYLAGALHAELVAELKAERLAERGA